MSFTPPGALFADDELRDPQTPAPQRARVANLNKQVDRLVQEKHNMQVSRASLYLIVHHM